MKNIVHIVIALSLVFASGGISATYHSGYKNKHYNSHQYSYRYHSKQRQTQFVRTPYKLSSKKITHSKKTKYRGSNHCSLQSWANSHNTRSFYQSHSCSSHLTKPTHNSHHSYRFYQHSYKKPHHKKPHHPKPPAQPQCELYPITLPASLVAGQEGTHLNHIRLGQGYGNYSWLSWQGYRDANALAHSLRAPGDSQTYINPHDNQDRVLEEGDWVSAVQGVKNSRKVRHALHKLVGQDILVPLWSHTYRYSKKHHRKLKYKVQRFGVINISGYRLGGHGWLSFHFKGYASCNNQPPVAEDSRYETQEDSSVELLAIANDSDGDALTYELVANPQSGTLSGNGPSYSYTPNLNFNGEDSFTFKVNDGEEESNVATISIVVNPVNDIPVVFDQQLTTNEDTPLTITLTGADTEASALNFTIIGQPTSGTISGNAPNLVYTANNNFSGEDSFTFMANDGESDSAVATIAMTVFPVNDAPIAQDITATTLENQALDISLLGSDNDGDVLTYTVLSAPSQGSLSVIGNQVNYTPNQNYFGGDQFTYQVSDGELISAVATADITVIEINKPPTITSIPNIQVNEDVAYQYDVKATDPNLSSGDILTYSLRSAPQGVAIEASSGVVSWPNPPQQYVGTVSEFNEQCYVVPTGSISVLDEPATGASANSSTFISPLFRDVTTALESAAEYTARESVAWDQRNNCLGCHIQTQSLIGLETSIDKVDVDENAVEYLLNALLDNQQTNGTIVSNQHTTSLLNTQTSLAVWSLSSYPDRARTLDARAKALGFLLQRESVSGNNIFWNNDHPTGWADNAFSTTAIIAQSAAALFEDRNNSSVELTPEQLQVADELATLVPGMVSYFLDGHANPPAEILHSAFRLMGLSELRPYIDDLDTLTQIDDAIALLDTNLRAAQRQDGGWNRNTNSTQQSSPIVSAWVGIALNYLQPPLTDTVVTNTIEYLLSVQNPVDGTWSDSSGIFGSSLLGPTSIVMAYLPVALDFLGNPDLNVAKIELIEQNNSATIEATIANRGIADVESISTVYFYAGTDSNAPLLGSIILPSAESGQATIASLQVADPSVIGTDIFVAVETDALVEECEIRNNSRLVAVIDTQVTDNEGLFDTQRYALNIEDANVAPEITSSNEIDVSSAQGINHIVDVSDADIGDAANFVLDGAPEGVFIDPRTGRLISDPVVLQAGTYTFDVMVTDLRGAQVTQTITLTVNENLPPVITSIPITQGTEEQLYSYPVIATDPNDDDLIYSLATLQPELSIQTLTGEIESDASAYLESLRGENHFCEAPPIVAGELSAKVKWKWFDGAGDGVLGPVIVVQLTDDNNDGKITTQDNPDVVFNSYIENRLVAVSGDTGEQIWKNLSIDVAGLGSPSAADIDGDGIVEIVTVSSDRTSMYAFEHTGELKWTQPVPGPRFVNGPRDSISISDIDSDGDPELVLGRAIFDHEGNLLAEGTGAYGGETRYGIVSVIADLNADGQQEIIAANTAYDNQGNIIWQNNSLPNTGLNAIGNFDGDDLPEIVLVTGARVYLLDSDGSLIWQRTIPGGGQGGAPTIADVDNDGMPEIGVAGAANYVVLESDGSIKWTAPSQDISSNRTGSSVFDFEADGKSEIVYADEVRFRIFDGETGAVRYETPNLSGTTLEYPVIADIDNDGAAEILYGGNSVTSGPEPLGLFALEAEQDNWAPTRAIWNQHAYHINNINDDGTVPINEVNSWLTHNTYRLNTFSDRSALAGADLALFKLNYNDNTQVLSVELDNRGLAPVNTDVLVEFFNGDADTGAKLGEVTVSSIAAGASQVLTLSNITVDALGASVTAKVTVVNTTNVNECIADNNSVSAAVMTAVAADPAGLSDTQTYLYSTVNVNNLPTISSTATNTIEVVDAYAVTATVSDIDVGDAHRFSLVDAPEGLAINAITGDITAPANTFAPGIYNYTVQVEDLAGETAEQVNVFTVNAPNNLPPQFTSTEITSVLADENYSYQATATDPDGDAVFFTLATSPAGMAIDGETGVITWLPNSSQVGLQIVDISAVDTNGATASQRFALTVQDPNAANNPPAITSEPNGAVVAGKTFSYTLVANDPDGDNLSYRLQDASTGMSINANGVFTWLPSNDNVGQIFTVSLLADDNRGGIATQTLSLPVNQAANNPPTFTSTPATQATDGALYTYAVTGTDSDGDTVSASLDSAPNGMQIDAQGIVSWTPAAVQANQVFAVVVRLTDARGAASTQSYSIGVNTVLAPNTPPSITSSPTSPAIIGERYTYAVVAADADGDTLNYNLSSAPTGMTISANGVIEWTPLAAQLGSFPVVIEVSDGQSASTQAFTLEAVNASATNNYPVINSSPRTETSVEAIYTYAINAQDPDGDALTYTLVDAPNGMAIDSDGAITWQPTEAQRGIANVVVRVSDGQLSALQSFTIRVQDPAPLEVFASVSPAIAAANQDITITLAAVGGVGDVNFSVTVDGVAVALNAQNQAVVSSSEFGVHTIIATATTATESDSFTTSYFITDPTDNTPPVVEISSPTNDSIITSPTDLIGSVVDDNLVSYEVLISPADKQIWTTIASGNNEVIDAALATFDPSLLLNGLYDVVVQAVDINNQVASDGVTLVVEEDLKVGNFSITLEDLNIPLAGVPIRITRTYDSRRRAENLDFGYGWSIGYQDVRVEESRDPGRFWTLNQYNRGPFGVIADFCVEPQGAPVVTVTLPNGDVERFEASASPRCSTFQVIKDVELTFEAVGDTQSTLEALNDSFGYFSGSDLVENGFFTTPINPQRYKLTTREGYEYFLDQDLGIEKVIDPNGYVLTYTNDGIFHSSGKSIEFVRNSQGIITEIVDPAGNIYSYDYDNRGDLVTATDSVQASSTYTYNNSHGLLDMFDPLGRRVIRNIYDDTGRMIAQEDEQGNRTEFNHDVAGRQSVVTDRNGNSSQLFYNERGFITTQIDAQGNTTEFSHDERGNQLSQTDALGNTTTATFNTNNDQLTATDALGNVTEFSYNQRGQETTITDERGNVFNNSYDAVGNLLTVTDPEGNIAGNNINRDGLVSSTVDVLGNSTTFTYDSEGNKLTEVDAEGATMRFTYDDNNNVLTETRERTVDGNIVNETTTYEYDARNRVVATTDALGNRTATEYDLAGQQVAQVDALGRRTEMAYDVYGRLVQTQYPDGTVESKTYDPEGNLLSDTDRLGRTTTYTYDELDRQVQTTYADGSTTQTEYDAIGRVIAEVDANGNRSEHAYDAAGRRILTHTAEGNQHQFEYDESGNLIAETDARNQRTEYRYNSLDQRTQTTYADGTTMSETFDALSRRTSMADQAGITTEYAYDKLGRLTSVTDVLNQVTSYTYDEQGNKLTQTDAAGRTTTWVYDALGRAVQRILPLGQVESMVYDAVGNVIEQTDFNGQTTAHTYDVLNRLTRSDYADGSRESMVYDTVGNRIEAIQTESNSDTRTTTYTYDNRNRLISETQYDGSVIEYQYDSQSNRTQVQTTPASGNASTVDYTYDVLNRLATTINGTDTTTYSYDAVGNRSRIAYANGTAQVYTYDSLNRLTRLESRDNTDAAIQRFDYTLHPTGRRTQIDELSGRSTAYTYDSLYRLTQESITDTTNGDYTAQYSYDEVGNRIQSIIDGVTTQYTYNDNDWLQSQGGSTYTHDAQGNTLSETLDGNTTTYGYNSQQEMVSTTKDGVESNYSYNADGIRTSANTTSYLVDSNRDYAQVLVETSAGNNVVYTYGDDLISQNRDTGTFFYHYDGLGSVRGLSDSAGALTDSYDYAAFGEVLNETGATVNNYKYTGEQFDQGLNQYYLRARYYNQQVGRFTQQDTWMGNNYDPVTLHKYLYANVDPVNFTDPTGNFSLGSFGVASNINAILTTASVASSAFNVFSAATDEDGLTAREVGFSILIAASGPAAGRLINLFTKTKKAKKAFSALENASGNAFKAARNIRHWTPKNKHLLSTSAKTKARFDTDDINRVRGWVSEGLKSPRAIFLPNENLPGTFRVVVDLGKQVGIKGQQKIRIIVGGDGKVINAFPVNKL